MSGSLQEILKQIAGRATARIGPKTTLVDDSYIATEPSALASAAGLDLELYSLARLVASEEGHAEPVYQLAVAEAVRNEAAKRGTSITAMLTYHTQGKPRAGHYGRQVGRLAATTLDPTAQNVAAARAALSGTNMVLGAHRFFAPRVHDAGTQAGKKIRSFESVLADWTKKDRLQWIGQIPGIDPYKLALLKKAMISADNSALLATVQAARQSRQVTV